MDKVLPPVVVEPGAGDNTSPVVTASKGEDNNDKMNEMIQQQMQVFQENLMKQFDGDFKEKLSKFESDKNELEDKKQHLAVAELLRSSNMSSEFLDFVYDSDIEIVKVKTKQLGDLISLEANKGIESRLKGSTPITGSSGVAPKAKEKPKYFV